GAGSGGGGGGGSGVAGGRVGSCVGSAPGRGTSPGPGSGRGGASADGSGSAVRSALGAGRSDVGSGSVVGSTAAGAPGPSAPGVSTRPTEVPGVPVVSDDPFAHSRPVTTRRPTTHTSTVAPAHIQNRFGLRRTGSVRSTVDSCSTGPRWAGTSSRTVGWSDRSVRRPAVTRTRARMVSRV